MPYYLIDENKNKVEVTNIEANLFRTILAKIHSDLNGTDHAIEFCTQAQYNQLVADDELVPNTYYYIIDDTTADDLEGELVSLTALTMAFQESLNSYRHEMDEYEATIDEHIRTGLRLDIKNVDCDFDFHYWEASSSSTNLSNYLSLHSSYVESTGQNNDVRILPAGTNGSIVEARVDYVSGDSGYIQYSLENIDVSKSYIRFKATNISGQYIYGNGATTKVPRSTTFNLYVKDIYGNEYNKPFTINFRTDN